MTRSPKLNRGFSLVELMITVAIAGILAAVAVPEYTRYIMRARQTESVTMISIISRSQFTHFATNDCFSGVEATPTTGMYGVTKQTWDSQVTTPPPDECLGFVMGGEMSGYKSFEDIGVRPSSNEVFYQYQCEAVFSDGAAVAADFICSVVGDLDGDGQDFELLLGTDNDMDGITIAATSGNVSAFPSTPVRVSPAIF